MKSWWRQFLVAVAILGAALSAMRIGMGIRALIVGVGLSLWPTVGWATITCGNAASGSDNVEIPTLAVTVTAETNRVTILGIHDRIESRTIDSVSDTGSGTWELLNGPESSTASTIRTWMYARTGGSDGAITVSIDFSATGNSAYSAATCYSDTAALEYVSSATALDNSFGTAHASNSRTFTATGMLVGWLATNNSVALSAVGTNQTNITNANLRGHLVGRAESSGTHALDVTTGASTNGLFPAALFQEAAAASTCTGGLLLMGAGKCDE